MLTRGTHCQCDHHGRIALIAGAWRPGLAFGLARATAQQHRSLGSATLGLATGAGAQGPQGSPAAWGEAIPRLSSLPVSFQECHSLRAKMLKKLDPNGVSPRNAFKSVARRTKESVCVCVCHAESFTQKNQVCFRKSLPPQCHCKDVVWEVLTTRVPFPV